MNRGDLISDEYLTEQRRLHAQPRGYGGRGDKWAALVHDIVEREEVTDVLDYGAGQGTLVSALRGYHIKARSYDPAVDAFEREPKPADMVTCTDVLEHIEPDKLDNVVAHIRSLARRFLFVVVSVIETDKRLSDGRQAHISLHDEEWWRERLAREFKPVNFFPISPHKQIVALYEAKA